MTDINYDNIQRKVAVVHADIEANCKQHGIRGILEHSDIERMIGEYDEEDKQARIYGKFQHLTGLVFKTFSRKIHVIEPFEITKADFAVYERFDPHPRNPDAVGWYAVNRWGQKFIVDELFMNGNYDEVTAQIKKRDDLYRIINRKADPWIFNEDQHAKENFGESKTPAMEYLVRGLYYTPASKQRTSAIKRTEQALKYQEVQGHLVQLPELFVFNTCVRHIWEFEHWQWHEYTGKSTEYKNRSEKPQDKDDHMMENLGRFLVDDSEWEPYHIESQYSPLHSNTGYDEVTDNLDPFA